MKPHHGGCEGRCRRSAGRGPPWWRPPQPGGGTTTVAAGTSNPRRHVCSLGALAAALQRRMRGPSCLVIKSNAGRGRAQTEQAPWRAAAGPQKAAPLAVAPLGPRIHMGYAWGGCSYCARARPACQGVGMVPGAWCQAPGRCMCGSGECRGCLSEGDQHWAPARNGFWMS